MRPVPFGPPPTFINASRIKRALARLFGEKVEAADFYSEQIGGTVRGVKVKYTAYKWRGQHYITHYEHTYCNGKDP